MRTLTVGPKGQITLPKDVLKHLGPGPGEKIVMNKLSGSRLELKSVRGAGNISDVFGMLKREGGPRLSIEEINEFAADGWAGKR
jgi:AbrB family looped-hinge helix DNA binding protein